MCARYYRVNARNEWFQYMCVHYVLVVFLLVLVLCLLFRYTHDPCYAPLLCLGRGFAKGEGFNVVCIIEGTKSDRNSHA